MSDSPNISIENARMKTAAIGAGLLTLLLLGAVITGTLPFERGSVWAWPYQPLTVPLRMLWGTVPLALIALILRGPGRVLLTSDQPTRQQESGALTAMWLAVFVSANAVMLMHPSGWAYPATLVINPASNSYFSTALHQPDLGELLHNYPEKMVGFASHAQTQSAGPVVFSGLVWRLAKASPLTPAVADTLLALTPGTNPDQVATFCRVWEAQISADDVRAALCLGLLMMAIGSLAVVPLYFLGKWLHAPGAGVFAALSFLLMPVFSLFSVSVDQMYPLVTAAALCGIWRGVSLLHSNAKCAWLWLLATGVWLGLGLFFNLGLIVAVALCGVFALLVARHFQVSARQCGYGIAVFLGGLLTVPLLLRLAFGYDLWAVFLTSNRLRDSLYYHARSYPTSLWVNLLDFFAFCGLPSALLWAWHLLRALQQKPRTVEIILPIAFVLILLLLDASGRVRGEAARMWIFLSPPLLVGAGAMLWTVWRQSRPIAAVWLALQAAQLIVFGYFLRVWGY